MLSPSSLTGACELDEETDTLELPHAALPGGGARPEAAKPPRSSSSTLASQQGGGPRSRCPAGAALAGPTTTGTISLKGGGHAQFAARRQHRGDQRRRQHRGVDGDRNRRPGPGRPARCPRCVARARARLLPRQLRRTAVAADLRRARRAHAPGARRRRPLRARMPAGLRGRRGPGVGHAEHRRQRIHRRRAAVRQLHLAGEECRPASPPAPACATRWLR